MTATQEIKARLDLVQYIGRTVQLRRAGRVYKACCPFHGEKTPSFVVNPDTQSWRCFGACAEGGDIFNFAMKQNGWTFTEALAELGKLAGVEVKRQTPEDRARDEANDRLRGMIRVAADYYHARLLNKDDAAAVSTLSYARTRRGLSDETIAHFQIGYAPDAWTQLLEAMSELGYSEEDAVTAGLAIRNDKGRVYDRFRNRLMIPITDERGRAVGFGARALNPEDNPKYLNSPQSPIFDKSHLLFGLYDAARTIRETETAVIVEGYMDAIQAYQAGYFNVTAQMGTAMTETQLSLIAPRWAKNIVLALDSDAAGQNATRRSLETARTTLQADYAGRLSVDFRVLALPDAKDPDDLIREHPKAWAELVAGAIPVADFVIAAEVADLPPNASIAQREAAARRLLPILAASENHLYGRDNIQKLAIKLRILERDLMAWADEQARLTKASAPRRQHGNTARSDIPRIVIDPNSDSPPDLPPLDLDEGYPYDDEQGDGGYEIGDVPGVRPQPRPIREESNSPLEAYCLRALFRQPDLVYHVNRKFRELAGSDEHLIAGPLRDLTFEDFSTTDYRALIEVFALAVQQDDQEPISYMRDHLADELLEAFQHIMRDDFDDLRPRLSSGLGADLGMVIKQIEKVRGTFDPVGEVVGRALHLRVDRLQRERRELEYALKDVDSTPEQAEVFLVSVALSSRAKARIDAELRKMAFRAR